MDLVWGSEDWVMAAPSNGLLTQMVKTFNEWVWHFKNVQHNFFYTKLYLFYIKINVPELYSSYLEDEKKSFGVYPSLEFVFSLWILFTCNFKSELW